jgi:hypothetical protein
MDSTIFSKNKFKIDAATGIATAGKEFPSNYSLEQNYPNPFNPTTKIRYAIPSYEYPLQGGARGGFTQLKVYDILGNEVATLINERKQPGEYEIEFNASNPANGTGLSSGIYYYQITSGSFTDTKKMVILK